MYLIFYQPSLILVFSLCFYGPSVRLGPLKYKNKNLANTPPSWPYAWSRTHIYQTVHRYTEPQAAIPSFSPPCLATLLPGSFFFLSHSLGWGVERPFEGGCLLHCAPFNWGIHSFTKFTVIWSCTQHSLIITGKSFKKCLNEKSIAGKYTVTESEITSSELITPHLLPSQFPGSFSFRSWTLIFLPCSP